MEIEISCASPNRSARVAYLYFQAAQTCLFLVLGIVILVVLVKGEAVNYYLIPGLIGSLVCAPGLHHERRKKLHMMNICDCDFATSVELKIRPKMDTSFLENTLLKDLVIEENGGLGLLSNAKLKIESRSDESETVVRLFIDGTRITYRNYIRLYESGLELRKRLEISSAAANL
jgi:hypothetical protein